MSKNIFQIIDIGSNTVCGQFLAWDKQKETLDTLSIRANVLKLGRHLIGEKKIPSTAVIKLLDSIKSFLKESNTFAKCHNFIIATSPLRQAQNAREIIKLIEKECSIKIHVLTGEEEGLLAFKSARYCFQHLPNHSLICDLGGGSFEMVYGGTKCLYQNSSWPHGLSKIKQKLSWPSKPTLEKSIEAREYCRSLLKVFFEQKPFAIETIVVTSSILKLALKSLYPEIDLQKVSAPKINLSEMIHLENNIYTEKTVIPFQKQSEDLLCLGLIFFQEMLKKTNIESLYVCPWSIREAYVWENLKNSSIT
ncbi:hypothetical protein AB834_03880 [PVC group bacterium (ex Bugula neritina AB1)]|nr:hypothetical protein AB834_03880 [PVC group bacterium (ex Bugula neritina AB1)]